MRTYFVAKLNECFVKLRQKITNIWKTTKPSLLAWSLEKRTYLTWAPICSDTAETTGIRGTRWICDDSSGIIFSSNTELKLGLWLWLMLNMDLNPFLPQSLKLGDKWKHGSSIQWMEKINTKEKDLLKTTFSHKMWNVCWTDLTDVTLVSEDTHWRLYWWDSGDLWYSWKLCLG